MAAKRIAPVIVLSTGRCGSTMISDVLNRHPKVLSLSEFFSFLGIRAFRKKRLDGKAMWDLCTRQSPLLRALLTSDKIISEIIYPFHAPQARFSPRNLPAILCTTLPHLTPDFDSLYDELGPVVRARPREDLADQYRFLFEWLRDRFDRDLWIERSGASLLFGFRLLKLFPEARVVHIYRDGRDTAMSMNRHGAFVILLATLQKLRRVGLKPPYYSRIENNTVKGPPPDAPPVYSALEGFVQSLVLRLLDLEQMARQEFELEAYGELWSRMILFGHRYLASLPPDRLLALSYEDVLQHPREKLTELIEFVGPGLADDVWLDEAVRIPRPNPSRYLALEPEAQLRLTRACAPGLEVLGYAT